MSNPFLIKGPALISVSGGRTSADLLCRVVEAHGGKLPDDVLVGFANTGKELEPTLRFVHELGSYLGCHIHWLEFETDLRSVGPEGRFNEVGFNSASRAGEPFERLIARKQAVPSTATGRWCTDFLKVRVLQDFMATRGYGEPGSYREVIGIRVDEAHRAANLRASARNAKRLLAFPLIDAAIRKSDVFAAWDGRPFDLMLPRGYGNCDQCPFIGNKNRVARARRDPAGVEQWARWELSKGLRMGRDFSFVEILGMAAQSPTLDLFPDDDADSECGTFCGASQ